MDPNLLREKLPDVESWVYRIVSQHARLARPVAAFGFSRLKDYYPSGLLQTAKVVVVPSVPVPPLTAMGFSGFEDFERMNAAGITYLDTYFVRSECRDDEALHFHELVHVAQWLHLGPTNFILGYALGHALSGGYETNPFERTAYALQGRFESGGERFDPVAVARADAECDFWRLVHEAGMA